MACGEFPLIACYSDRTRGSRPDVKLDISDDYTLLNTPEEQTLAISTDTLVVDNHFLPDIDPTDLAYRALAVNLNNLATMEAGPVWLTLTLTLPDVDEAWPESFNDSLSDPLNYYDMQLISGDTTRGPLLMTLSIHGFVPMGQALTRFGAKPGDWTYVTGISGGSTAGLAILQDRLQVADAKDADYLIKCHLRPPSHVLQGQTLRNLANSAIDPPDGLISDLGHIVKAGDCGARIDLALLPFSNALSRYAEPEQALRWALSGGEDYELCFTMPELNRGAPGVVLGHLSVPFTCVGQMIAGIGGFYFIHDGEPVTLDWKGYGHLITP